MKKILFIFFLINLAVYCEEVTLDNLLKSLEETSYRKAVYELEKRKTDSKEKYYKLDKYNGVKSSVETKYDTEEQVYKTTGRGEFGDLYIEGKRNHNPENDLIFGINKSIKDMIFSQSDSELAKNELTKEYDWYTFLKNMEEQKISLINLYRDYKNSEFELKIKRNGLTTLQSEELMLRKAYELGAVARIELDSLEASRRNIEIELETLEKNILRMKKRFLYDFKIDISDKTLANISPDKGEVEEYISKVGYKDIEKLKIEKEISKENIRYMNYNNKMPDLSVGLERDTRIDESRIVMKISKPLFYYDMNLENEKSTYSQKEILLNQKIEETVADKLEIESNLLNYRKEYQVLKNKAELEKNKYEIKKLEYSLGKINYLDVMESFDDYLEYEVSQEKARNILNSYIYEVMVRGE